MAKNVYCPNCGLPMMEDDRFCEECGYDVSRFQEDANIPEYTDRRDSTERVPGAGQYRADGDPAVDPSRAYRENETSDSQGRNRRYRDRSDEPQEIPLYPPRKEARKDRSIPQPVPQATKKRILPILILTLLIACGAYLGLTGKITALKEKFFKPKENLVDSGDLGKDPKNVTPIDENIQTPSGVESSVEGGVLPTQEPSKSPGSSKPPESSKSTEPTATYDLTKAASYLPMLGLRLTYLIENPSGLSKVIKISTAKVIPHEAIVVSEAAWEEEGSLESAFGIHYVQKNDGIYLILDKYYDTVSAEMNPHLMDNLTTGRSWKRETEYENSVRTVMATGADVDMGFKVLNNCLIVREDNHHYEYYVLSYYAPGYGLIKTENRLDGFVYRKLLSIEHIDQETAEQEVKKWCPNYDKIEL